ncbi:bifunctional DNA primase/polymerase [Actinacidiphila glaucinigra]|uniref:bifunctional DNA primase/polymerase n=1 Tax=Actinacidiphila glaucinigra TaxID=235986 RepID=UPI0033E24979
MKVVEDTVEHTIAAPWRNAGQLLDAAVGYAEERHWDVLPGAWLVEHAYPSGASGVPGIPGASGRGGPRCSCGDTACPAPGAHPSGPGWVGEASGSGPAVRRMWQRQPHASVLLPTGRTFDAIDVPEDAGCLALARMERMELPLGPVLGTPSRRMIFFVLPGAAAKVPDLLRRLGWAPSSLDLVVRGDGDWVPAPPTRLGTGGVVQWVRQPTALNRWLPDTEELISPLAYACGR